jgi:hypothetical protein
MQGNRVVIIVGFILHTASAVAPVNHGVMVGEGRERIGDFAFILVHIFQSSFAKWAIQSIMGTTSALNRSTNSLELTLTSSLAVPVNQVKN